MKSSDIRILESETILRTSVFDVSRHRIRENEIEYEREIVEHKGSAVILPRHKNGEISLVKQYRHAAGEFLLELPAGSIEIGESPMECAYREVLEETGYRAKRLKKLSEFYVSPGFLTEKMFLFLASGLEQAEQDTDFDERIEIARFSMQDAVRLVANGTIVDAKTIIGILLASNSPETAI